MKNLKELGEFKNQILIITNIVGKSLSHIHTTCFDKAVDELNSYINSKSLRDSSLMKLSKADFQKKLYDFYSRGDKNIGVIYSLSFLRFLAQNIDITEVIARTEESLIKHYEIIRNKIKNGLC